MRGYDPIPQTRYLWRLEYDEERALDRDARRFSWIFVSIAAIFLAVTLF